jgi:hypothetical protein
MAFDRYKPQFAIGSAHGLSPTKGGCPAKPCPALQKWSHVQCKCVPSGIIDGTIPAITPPPFGPKPGTFRDYTKYPIPGEEPRRTLGDFVPAGSPLPCPANKEWKNGGCRCKQACTNQYFIQDYETCECINPCKSGWLPENKSTCCFSVKACVENSSFYADMTLLKCKASPDLDKNVSAMSYKQALAYQVDLIRRLMHSPYEVTGKSEWESNVFTGWIEDPESYSADSLVIWTKALKLGVNGKYGFISALQKIVISLDSGMYSDYSNLIEFGDQIAKCANRMLSIVDASKTRDTVLALLNDEIIGGDFIITLWPNQCYKLD